MQSTLRCELGRRARAAADSALEASSVTLQLAGVCGSRSLRLLANSNPSLARDPVATQLALQPPDPRVSIIEPEALAHEARARAALRVWVNSRGEKLLGLGVGGLYLMTGVAWVATTPFIAIAAACAGAYAGELFALPPMAWDFINQEAAGTLRHTLPGTRQDAHALVHGAHHLNNRR